MELYLIYRALFDNKYNTFLVLTITQFTVHWKYRYESTFDPDLTFSGIL